MTTKVITGTYASGYSIHTQTLSIASTGLVEGSGVQGSPFQVVTYTISNSGRIKVTDGYQDAVDLGGSAVITNGGVGDAKASIIGYQGLDIFGGGTVTNYGVITGGGAATASPNGVELPPGVRPPDKGDPVDGIYLGGVGMVTNEITGAISGMASGVRVKGAGAVTNLGAIHGGSVSGVELLAGGSISNGSASDKTALIAGGAGPGVFLAGVGTVTNFGVISSSGGAAVKFGSSKDVLVVEAGSKFTGAVQGDKGLLDLASGVGTLAGLFTGGDVTVSGSMATTKFSDFATLKIGAGASFTTASGAIAAGEVLDVAGALTVTGALASAAAITIAGGKLVVDGAVTGAGKIEIGRGSADFAGTFKQGVAFIGTSGILELGASKTYTGVISGFSKTGKTALDLADIAFVKGKMTAVYKGTTTSGFLTVKNGTSAAFIKFSGDYTTSKWTFSSDGHGGTRIVDRGAASAHRFIDAAAGFGAGAGASAAPTERAWHRPSPVLARPRSQLA